MSQTYNPWVCSQKDGRLVLERKCRKCNGTGIETARTGQHYRCCSDPDNLCMVEHPDNRQSPAALSSFLVRCDVCGLFWFIHEDRADDSIDLPGPELLGLDYPDRLRA